MRRRRHTTPETASEALYSDCGHYRYALTRTWNPSATRILFILLNPSTASERQNDPTIERCQRRAARLGYGAFRVVNLFAYRATDPRQMRGAAAPVGAANDPVIRSSVTRWRPDLILCAWGAHGQHLDRASHVTRLLRDLGRPLWHLGLTRDGHPRHPLYLRNDAVLHPWHDPDEDRYP